MLSWNTLGKLKHSLASKFAGAVFLFGLTAGIIITALSLSLSYFHDQREVQSILEHVRLTVGRTVPSVLQLPNDDIVTTILDCLIAIPGIEQVTIHLDDGGTLERGNLISKRTLPPSRLLLYDYDGQRLPLGFTKNPGDDLPTNNAWSNVTVMASHILILAILSAAFSFLLFYFLIGRHLQEIANYSAKITLDTLDNSLELKRGPHNEKRDELDLISDALNSMRNSLIASMARIREHDAKYQAIVENSSDAIVSIDSESRIIYANPATCRYLNLSFERIIGKTPHELGFADNAGTSIDRAVRSVLADGITKEISIDLYSTTREVQSFEMQLTPSISLSGEIVSVVGIARDITTRKKTESILQVAFQHVPILMAISELETGTFIEINDRFTEITGYTREQTVGTSSIELGLISRKARHRIKKAVIKEGFVENMELQLTRADGSAMTCIYSCDTIEVNGSTTLLSMTHDITEQRQALLERENMERQLQQAMKMEAIGTLAGGIAHDFNNILGAILGYGQLALEQTTPDNPIHDDLMQVIQAGNRASDLVKQILTFSRQDQEDFRPVRLQPIIKEVAKLLRSTMPATIELRLDIDEKCGAILADSVQLHQVLMNLCTNARQAIGNTHGAINISLHLARKNTQALCSIENKPLREIEYLELNISDTGKGMPPEVVTRIFDPFFTTRERDHGTGLGLAVTHGIIAKHQGSISVASEPGNGTVFKVYLPVIAASPATNNSRIEENLHGQECILLVDDEKMLVEILERSLRTLGYKVFSFCCSREAVNFFFSSPDTIDLVVTDMTMPGMTGVTISREMRTIRPELQVILCTGYSDAIDEETATAEGISTFLRKPVIGKDIARAIRNLRDTE